jgi:hypothetical protein
MGHPQGHRHRGPTEHHHCRHCAAVDSNVSQPQWIGGKLLYLKVGELILATPQ